MRAPTTYDNFSRAYPVRIDLKQQAAENLRFIRRSMERAERVSAVSGVGGIVMGLIGLGAMLAAWTRLDVAAQMLVWMVAAVPAFGVGALSSWIKARSRGELLTGDASRRFLLCLLPVVMAGGLLTWLLWSTPQVTLLPAVWMMLYGCGLTAAGTYAVPPVMQLGLCFFVAGAFVSQAPDAWSNVALGLTFGGFHVLFGIQVCRRYGG